MEFKFCPNYRVVVASESSLPWEGGAACSRHSLISLCLALQFGDSQQLRLVRILRSTVMVRVGGGWMALDEFLVKNDPCRGKEPS